MPKSDRNAPQPSTSAANPSSSAANPSSSATYLRSSATNLSFSATNSISSAMDVSAVASTSRISQTSHTSRQMELDNAFFGRRYEAPYPPWWTFKALINWFHNLPDNTLWNCYICVIVLIGLLWVAGQYTSNFKEANYFYIVYDISYALHVFAVGYRLVREMEDADSVFCRFGGLLLDAFSYTYYFSKNYYWKLGCYYVRLHRPFGYLWSMNNNNLKGSVVGTTLEYCYIYMVLRATWAWVWVQLTMFQTEFPSVPYRRMGVQLISKRETPTNQFIIALYIVNKMFIPIGMPVTPKNDVERITSLAVIISGCLVVTGAAVASLSLVISLYMSPEETFRSRYKLIIKDLKDANVPPSLREKVQNFYRMYWHKQGAVSATKLLPTFPPTLPATIYTDIYFEATQKSRILRDLSYQFLSELAKKMETIHYIPGDVIIERNAKKSAIIYITYGDIEIITAEDDITAILRFTRGTILTPSGGAAAVAASRSHVTVRAATFCTAHVLHAADLWRTVHKYSAYQNHGIPIMTAFNEQIRKVKRHYTLKIPVVSTHKSSILHFNRNLLALKEMTDAKGNSLIANRDVLLEIAGYYNMRNRLDSTLTDESDEICLRQTFPCVLQPWSSLLLAWHSLIALIITWISITYPYVLVYHEFVDIRFRLFDYLITLIFVVDLIVHLATGAQVEEGIPITFAQTASQQMRSKWFVLDVIGTLPIFEVMGDGHYAGLNKVLRLPKVFRVLKVIEEKCVNYRNVLRFCIYLFLLVVACYIVAAMQQAFMNFQSDGYCVVTNFTHSPYWEKRQGNKDSIHDSMTFSLYWAISMIMFTTHIETWSTDNLNNVLYTMIILEFCIVLRTFMEAVYSATIMVTTAMSEDYDARIATVRHFLISNEVDPELRRRFITYLQLCWYTDKAYKMTHKKNTSIFFDLPPHVYQDIVGRRRIKYILSIPVMKMLKTEDLKTLASNAHLFYTPPNEILMNTGDIINEIYVVVKGICEAISPETHNTAFHITANDHFGSVVCLLRLPAFYTVRAVTHVQMFCISKRHLKALFDNPQIKEAIEYIKTQPEYIRLQLRQQSFLTYVPPPPTPNVERFKLPRKYEPDYEYLHPFKSLGFLSILRYIFPRFTIRPDGKYLSRYEWVRVSCALLSAILFPNYTYLVLQWPWLYYVTFLLDASAVFDIFQRMLVGYYNEAGILVYHPSSTAAYYLKGSFILDLFGCLPLEKLQSESVDFVPNRYRVTHAEQLLMMNRLLQLYRFPSIMQVLQNYIVRRDIQMVISAVPILISMFNFVTCMMIFSSVKIFFFKNDQGRTGWLLVPFEDKGGSWVDLFRSTFRFNLTSSPWNLYLATHFWVVYETTTTGYGKFKPSNENLLYILFVAMIGSGMVITYFTVRIISIRSNVNKDHAAFQQHMRDITMFMKRETLDPKLQNELRLFYEYNWEKMGGIDYRGVLKLCDLITLRTDAIMHIYGPTFAKCPLLAQCDVALLRQIGRSVRSVYFLRDMKIIEYDDVVKDVYFVDYGGVESRVPVGKMTQAVRLPRGSLFGNLEGTPAQRVPMNIVATTRLHLLMINSQAFYHIINEFPATKALMEVSRMTDNQYYILGNIEEFKVKLSRDHVPTTSPTTKKDIIKYIYFQEEFVLLYLIVVSLACIFMDLYNAGYQDNQAWLILTLYILDMCFFLKILMQFSLPLLVTGRNLKAMLLPIRRMYFKREFKYDMLSCLPLELCAFQLETDRWLWFSLLRLNRMFRIVTVNNCLKHRSERIKVNVIMSTILTVTVWFSVFVHAATCLWYFIGRLEEQNEPKSSWIYDDQGKSWCRNEYICSLYFVITTFTQNGVGDIMPKKQSEVIFVTILMIISTLVFMTYVGEFSKLIQYQSFRSFSFYSQYLELQEFLKNNRVSENLVTFVKKYSLHLWRSSRGMQVPLLLKEAPLSLRLRVMSAAYMHHFNTHYVFEDCEQAFLRQLVGCLRLYHYNENMYVVKQSDITNCMHIVQTGQVQGTAEDTLPEMFHEGSFFGVLQGLVRDTPYTHSYQTVTKSEVLTLRLDDWEYLLAHFPDSKEAIYKHMSDVTGSHMNSDKWPGGHDPEPPPESRRKPSGRDIGKSNLPKFFPYDRKRTFEAGTSLFTQHSSAESIYSYPSRDISRYNMAGTSRSTAARLTFRSSVDRDSLRNEPNVSVLAPESKHGQQARKVGKLEKVTRILKNLMGRYSDMDLKGFEMEDEEEATQTVLKQLDEARRLIGEIEKKNRHRTKKRLGSFLKEEDTEKFMFTSDILNEDQSLEDDSGILLPRPLLIQDEESRSSFQEVNSMLPEASYTTEETELTPSVDIIRSTGVLPDWDTEEIQKMTIDINSPANETKEEHQDGPGWGSRVIQETDADIEIIPEIQLPTKSSGHLEDVNTQTLPEMANTQVNTDEHIDPDAIRPEFSPGTDKSSWTSRPSQELDADIGALPKDKQKRKIEDETDYTIKNTNNKKDNDSLLESTDADIAALPENIESQIVKQDSLNLNPLSTITEEPSTSQEASTSPIKTRRKTVTLKYDEEKPTSSSHNDHKDDDNTTNEASDIPESSTDGSPTPSSKERKPNEPKK